MLRFVDELEKEMQELVIEPYRKAYYSSEREKSAKRLESDKTGTEEERE